MVGKQTADTAGGEPTLKSTTLKMPSRVGGGLRMLAAINGESVSQLAVNALHKILEAHGAPTAEPTATKNPTGRPGPTVQQAAAAVLKLRPSRKDAIPTRIETADAIALADLAERIEASLGDLATEGAILLLKRANTDFVREVAGLSGEQRYMTAMERVQSLAAGNAYTEAPKTEQATAAATTQRKAGKAVPAPARAKATAVRNEADAKAPAAKAASSKTPKKAGRRGKAAPAAPTKTKTSR